MKRREALKNLGFGITAGLVLPTWLSSCSKDEEGPEIKYKGVVGIVGAGAAGLAVADYLISKGIKVKIFEASDRVGGRVRFAQVGKEPALNELAADFPVELGADRIFGIDSEMGRLVKLLKIPTTKYNELPGIADYYIINDEYYAEGDINAAELQALQTFKTSLSSYTGSVQAAANAAGINSDMMGIINSWLANAYGTSADRIDAKALGDALNLIEHGNEEFMLTTNPINQVITSRYAKAVKRVQINRAVKAIDYSGALINLTILNTSDNSQETVMVDKLVVTAPIPVLKNSSLISFSPALPATKTDALSRIGMDASIRVIIEFKQNNFFRKPLTGNYPAFIYGGTEVPSYFFPGVGRSEINVTLNLTINGPKAEQLSLLQDKDKIQLILDEMDVVFDGLASANVRKYFAEDVPPDVDPTNPVIYIIKDWSKETYIGGGQSYPMLGGTNDDRVALAEPIDDRLFFAGEATDVTGEFGTISGAIKSGERAAEQVAIVIIAENEGAS